VAEPSLYISGFTKYLGAPPQRAGVVARQLKTQVGAKYDPRTDFWKQMRPALVNDRRTSRDGQAVWAAAANATPSKTAHYTTIAQRWEQVIPRWDGGTFSPVPTLTVKIGGLSVKIPASFAEGHPDGGLEVVYTHLNSAALPDPLPDAIMRILQRRHPAATITYVDVHRPNHIRTSDGRDLTSYDAYLDQAGMYLAFVLTKQAAA
jgi:hypothetical protein